MSYLDAELSVHDGRPVELYRFARGLEVWRYASGTAPVEHADEIYEPIPIERGAIAISSEQNRQALTISVPRDNPVAQLWLLAPPESVVTVTLYRLHGPDSACVWKGRVTSTSWRSERGELSCEPISASLRGRGARPRTAISCGRRLYAPDCGVFIDGYATHGIVEAVVGLTVRAAAFASLPSGWFAAGVLGWGETSRLILAHAGTDVALASAIPGLSVGAEVVAYAGCDHSYATCVGKFGNEANFGGCPWLPRKNPFSGDAAV